MISRQPTTVDPATVALIRRAPTAPPAGIPQRTGTAPPAAVPAVARDLAKPAPAPRTPVTATGSPAEPGSLSRAKSPSLLDRVPAGLFERARVGLATSIGGMAIPSIPLSATHTRGPGPAVPPTGEIRRFHGFAGAVSARSAMTEIDGREPTSQAVADALTPREWDELVDLVVDRLEDRVRDELARRGRRFSPGVF
jgi:hypothetical protein